MFHSNLHVGVNYIELLADFGHLEDILRLEWGEGWVTDEEVGDDAMAEFRFDNDADYLRDQQERLADRYY